MKQAVEKELKHFMAGLKKRNPHEKEFHQAVEEVATSVMPWYLDHAAYRQAEILERVTEPDRIVIFPRHLGNRRWRRACEPCLAGPVQSCAGSLQGGLAFPSVGDSKRAQVSRL